MKFDLRKDCIAIQAENVQDIAYLERLFKTDFDGPIEDYLIVAGSAGHSVLLHGRAAPETTEQGMSETKTETRVRRFVTCRTGEKSCAGEADARMMKADLDHLDKSGTCPHRILRRTVTTTTLTEDITNA